MLRTASCLFICVLVLSGCSMLPIAGKKELTEQSKAWQKMVRWGEYEKACSSFADSEVQQQCRQQFSSPGLSFADVEMREVLWDEDGKGAVVTLSLEYIKPPSATLKRLVLRQRWEVRDSHWQLLGPPPQLP